MENMVGVGGICQGKVFPLFVRQIGHKSPPLRIVKGLVLIESVHVGVTSMSIWYTGR